MAEEVTKEDAIHWIDTVLQEEATIPVPISSLIAIRKLLVGPRDLFDHLKEINTDKKDGASADTLVSEGVLEIARERVRQIEKGHLMTKKVPVLSTTGP